MKKVVIWGLCGLGFLAVACSTASVENSQSSASALEEDIASDVAGDEDTCSDVDGDSGSGGPTDDGASTFDGDSGSGGPTDDGASSVDGDSGSGGNLNLAAVTPKPKPKPACVCKAPNAPATSASGCPKVKTETRTDTVNCVSTGTAPGNYTNSDGNWFCHAGDGITSASPHGRCAPSTGSPNATHTHKYEIRYNFAAAKKCCFYAKVEVGCTCADGSRC